MKRLALAVALACVLSASALAGEIPSTGAPAAKRNTERWFSIAGANTDGARRNADRWFHITRLCAGVWLVTCTGDSRSSILSH